MDPVSQMAQAHAAMVLQHMMSGRMGLPSPYPIHQVGGPPPGTGSLFGQTHPGLLHLLGLGGHDYSPGGPIRLNPGGPGAPFGPPNGGVITGQLPPGYGPPGPVGGPGGITGSPILGGAPAPPGWPVGPSYPYQPWSIKAWNA